MTLGIFCRTFAAKDVQWCFEEVSAHGIAQVHYNMVCSGLTELPLDIPQEALKAARHAADENNIQIIGLSSTFNMIHPEVDVREEGLQSLNALCAAAPILGTNMVSLCTGSKDPLNKWKWHPENSSESAWKDLMITMDRALSIAEEKDVILGVEPENGNVVKDAPSARRLLDQIRNDRLRIILDPANLFEQVDHPDQIRDLISEACELLAGDVVVAHAKDRSLRGRVLPAGHGDIDFEFFIGQLKQIGFDGPVILHGLDEKDVGFAANYLRSKLTV